MLYLLCTYYAHDLEQFFMEKDHFFSGEKHASLGLELQKTGFIPKKEGVKRLLKGEKNFFELQIKKRLRKSGMS